MGLVHLYYSHDGDMIYSCKMCNAHLSDRDHLTSKNFSGRSGQAYLFSEVYNVYVGKKDKETLQTGNYIVRKVFCLKCREYNNTRTRVGWTYEFAEDKEQVPCCYTLSIQTVMFIQQWKEGHTVLEVAYLRVIGQICFDDIPILQ
jgi:hypothetical protein